ncbi:GDP-L-fucose synthase [Ornithinimicrobium sp. EGI L100131]|nr:GDP-L-fucose synthase [Ornithinimicrobium sediminis]MCE0485998.1 GDP-L-fucose synthase [Ornithinimicrobium sediminis]
MEPSPGSVVETDELIYVAGHRGLAGGAIVRALEAAGFHRQVTRTHAELDLTELAAVMDFFSTERPDHVFLAAARVGGIAANVASPVEFLLDNLRIQNNVLEAAHGFGVTKLMFLGSSCIFPRAAPQPMGEDLLLTGPLEPTNESYALAKIAGMKLASAYRRQHGRDFVSVMPCSLYGPGDNFHPETSHVVPALLRRFHEATMTGADEVVVWGTGRPLRELMYVDDFAQACVFLMNTWSQDGFINVGTGHEITTGDLARLIGRTVGYEGAVVFDHDRPDGMPRKVLDVSRLNDLGWTAPTHLVDGLRMTYAWFAEHYDSTAPVRGQSATRP